MQSECSKAAFRPSAVTILGLVGPLFFLFPSHPLSLLIHLGPSSSDSHHLLMNLGVPGEGAVDARK